MMRLETWKLIRSEREEREGLKSEKKRERSTQINKNIIITKELTSEIFLQ